MSRPKVNVQQKAQKEMPEFTAEVDSLSVDQLNARLAQLAKDSDEVENTKEACEALEEAREAANQLSTPFKDAKNAIRLKSRYIIALLKDKGQ